MKKLLFIILCVGAFVNVKAQSSAEAPPVIEIEEPKPKIDTSQRIPSFPGGDTQLMAYLKKNQRKPIDDHTQGRVYVTFIIEKDGSLTDIKVAKSLSPDTDAEALRLIKKMPKWNPGIQNNQQVRVQYSIPITFQ